MIRLTRLTDYGIVLLTYVAQHREGSVHSVTELAAEADLPLPTVSKVVKTLARKGLLKSHRGVKGGYVLARMADDISVAEVVAALDGPIAITECSHRRGRCNRQPDCPASSNLQIINQAVFAALDNITLEQMTRPLPQPIQFMDRPRSHAMLEVLG